jgi:hypothetical protein
MTTTTKPHPAVVALPPRADTKPKILLHIQAPEGETDQDAGPTPKEARWLAAKLIEAADEVDRWATR